MLLFIVLPHWLRDSTAVLLVGVLGAAVLVGVTKRGVVYLRLPRAATR